MPRQWSTAVLAALAGEFRVDDPAFALPPVPAGRPFAFAKSLPGRPVATPLPRPFAGHRPPGGAR